MTPQEGLLGDWHEWNIRDGKKQKRVRGISDSLVVGAISVPSGLLCGGPWWLLLLRTSKAPMRALGLRAAFPEENPSVCQSTRKQSALQRTPTVFATEATDTPSLPPETPGKWMLLQFTQKALWLCCPGISVASPYWLAHAPDPLYLNLWSQPQGPSMHSHASDPGSVVTLHVPVYQALQTKLLQGTQHPWSRAAVTPYIPMLKTLALW